MTPQNHSIPQSHREIVQIRVARTNETLAHRAQMARSLRDRLVGLLGRSVLPEGEGLILLACRSIHTVCMRFAIDAVFVDGRWRVLRICKALPPWRMSPIVWRATAVIELPAGAAQQAHLAVGDRLVLQPVLEQNPLDKASASQVDFE